MICLYIGTNTGSCGLITAQKDPVPLKSIEVELEVRDHVATVVSTLNYENKEDKPLEAVFVFPLPGDAAICHFSAQIGQTQIVAEVKEKQKARELYDDALSSGQQVCLLAESDESPDIFSLCVGSLPPGESASIRLEYVTELAVQADDGLRFCLPAVLNPRYQPQGRTTVAFLLILNKYECVCGVQVKLAAGHKFDRDVELLIYYKDAHQPIAVVEAGQASAEPGSLMGDPMVMVSLYPEFPQSVMSSTASCGEFVFLMDRSGSMGFRIKRRSLQTCIHSAKDTLLLLLKSLPMGCYFNIYSFGSRYEHIFPKSVEYSRQTMEEALKKVKKMKADLGGTEILEPLKHIYSQPCILNQPRQLFVLTRGWVKNDKEVIDLVKKNSSSHRCFSFGTGENTSYNFINKISKEGGGHAQFITATDKIQPKVMQSLQFALQPSVIDISVTWDLPKEVSVTVLTPPITSILQGQRSLIYAQLTGQVGAAEGCVTLKYSLAGHPSENQLHFSLRPAEDTGLTVHMLAARTLIRSLEMEARDDKGERDEEMKKKVEELSIQSGVSSAFTAFIAVSKSSGEAIQGPLIPPPGECYFWHISAALLGQAQNYHDIHICNFLITATESELSVKDPLLQLISLLEASGCWLLKPALASVLGKTSKEVANLKPASTSSEVWATILALIWLHGFKMDAKDEWELLAMKAASKPMGGYSQLNTSTTSLILKYWQILFSIFIFPTIEPCFF
uniref:VIT domain-containing protein n=1 Tax=Pundamilia nyererei TaxID=303518 RepID=A0A3B4EWC9_9CICH